MHTGKHKTTQRSRILVKQGCVKSSLPGLLRLGDCTKETACHLIIIHGRKPKLTTRCEVAPTEGPLLRVSTDDEISR